MEFPKNPHDNENFVDDEGVPEKDVGKAIEDAVKGGEAKVFPLPSGGGMLDPSDLPDGLTKQQVIEYSMKCALQTFTECVNARDAAILTNCGVTIAHDDRIAAVVAAAYMKVVSTAPRQIQEGCCYNEDMPPEQLVEMVQRIAGAISAISAFMSALVVAEMDEGIRLTTETDITNG